MPERTDLSASVEGNKVREAEIPSGRLHGFHSAADALKFDPQFHLFVMWLVLHQTTQVRLRPRIRRAAFVTGPQFVIPEPLTRAGGAARIQISPDDDP